MKLNKMRAAALAMSVFTAISSMPSQVLAADLFTSEVDVTEAVGGVEEYGEDLFGSEAVEPEFEFSSVAEAPVDFFEAVGEESPGADTAINEKSIKFEFDEASGEKTVKYSLNNGTEKGPFPAYTYDEYVSMAVAPFDVTREEAFTDASCKDDGTPAEFMLFATIDGRNFSSVEYDGDTPVKKTFKDTEYKIQAKPEHQWSADKHEQLTPSTCSENGTERIYQVCEVCGKEQDIQASVDIEKLPHTPVKAEVNYVLSDSDIKSTKITDEKKQEITDNATNVKLNDEGKPELDDHTKDGVYYEETLTVCDVCGEECGDPEYVKKELKADQNVQGEVWKLMSDKCENIAEEAMTELDKEWKSPSEIDVNNVDLKDCSIPGTIKLQLYQIVEEQTGDTILVEYKDKDGKPVVSTLTVPAHDMPGDGKYYATYDEETKTYSDEITAEVTSYVTAGGNAYQVIVDPETKKITEIQNPYCVPVTYYYVETCEAEEHSKIDESKLRDGVHYVTEDTVTIPGDPSKHLLEKNAKDQVKVAIDEDPAKLWERSELDDLIKNVNNIKIYVAAEYSQEAPYCAEETYTADVKYYCAICGELLPEYTQTVTIKSDEHEPEDEAVLDESTRVPSTCDKQGHVDAVLYCKNCGKELSRKTIDSPLLEHDFSGQFKIELVGKAVVDKKDGAMYDAWVAAKEAQAYDAEDQTLYSGSTEGDVETAKELGVILKAYAVCKNCGTKELTIGEFTKDAAVKDKMTDADAYEKYKDQLPENIKLVYSDVVVDPKSCNIGQGTITITAYAVDKDGNETVLDSQIKTYYTNKTNYQSGNKHVAAEAVTENFVEPTAETEGSYDTVTYCKICGFEMSRSHTVLPKVTHVHEMTENPEKAATCKEDGHRAYLYCSGCGNYFEADDTEGANPISADDFEEKFKIASTGTEHELEKQDAKEATCTEAGYEEYYKCTVCEKLFSDAEGQNEIEAPVAIEALGHDPAEPVEEEREDGKYNVVYCNRCGEEISAEKIEEEITPTPTPTPAPVVEAPAKAEITATQANDKKGVLKVTVKKLADATAYEVGYKEAGTKGYTTETFDSNKASFSGVAKDKLYRIRARGINDGGEGKYGFARRWMHSVTFSLKAGKGTLTVNIKDTDTSEKYQIRYADNADLNNYKVLNTKSTTATISGLTAGTKYYVRVVPYKRDAEGIRYTGVLSNQRAKAAK